MRIASALSVNVNEFFTIEDLLPVPIFVKCEALNLAGSVKIKPAFEMIEGFERSGRLLPGGSLIESSSGNLGIALSMISAAKGYDFTCVTDPNASVESVAIMRAFGATVTIVEGMDKNGGYLGTRIALIEKICADNPRLIWVNQYANLNNWGSHFLTTGPELLSRFPRIDHLFIGVGTGGTFMGCARYFREHSPWTRIVAVDVEGSVTFGSVGGVRRIPGLGTSRRPDIVDASFASRIVHVSEKQTVTMCRRLARSGLLAGGSTGSVLAGIDMCAQEIGPSETVVTLMPDLGLKYLDTIYNDEWATKHGFIDVSHHDP